MNFRTTSDGQVIRKFLKKAESDSLIIRKQINKLQTFAGVPVEDRYYVPAEDTATALGFIDDFKEHPVLFLSSILLILVWLRK